MPKMLFQLIRALTPVVVLVTVFSGTIFADNIIRLGCPIDILTPDGDSVLIPVYITNDVNIACFTLPFNWNSTDVVITSFDLTGSCLPMGMQFMFSMTTYPGEQKVLPGSIDFSGMNPLTPQNDALLFSMWAQIPAGASQQYVDIDTGFIAPAGTWVFAKQGGGNAYPAYVDCGVGDIVIAYAPVVSDIPDQTITEGNLFAVIALDDYVQDYNHDDSEIVWTCSGVIDLDVSINSNRVATILTPDPQWNGVEVIMFTATNPLGASDSDDVILTVLSDCPPLIDPVFDQTVVEGDSFMTIPLQATDCDHDSGELSWSYFGNNQLAVFLIPGSTATVSIPHSEWSGSETITFVASDPSTVADSVEATYTVTAVNDPPVITVAIPDQNVLHHREFIPIELDNYVHDVDNTDQELVWSYSGNDELIVTIDVSRIASVESPFSDWTGTDTVIFIVADPELLSTSDTVSFSITQNNSPSSPQLSAPGDSVTVETNQPILSIFNSIDNDGDSLYYVFEISLNSVFFFPLILTKTEDVGTITQITIDSTLEENQQFWWRVKASDYYAESGYSDIRTFFVNAVNTPPSSFSLVTPQNGFETPVEILSPEFVWGVSYDPDPFDSVLYTLYIALDSNFAFVITSSNISSSSYVIDYELQWGLNYWWKTMGEDLNNGITWSNDVWQFRTVTLGDADNDGEVSITDVVYLVDYIFLGGSAPAPLFAGDADCDGEIIITDAVYLIAYIFIPDSPEPCY